MNSVIDGELSPCVYVCPIVNLDLKLSGWHPYACQDDVLLM
jgi:hypothetical protein